MVHVHVDVDTSTRDVMMWWDVGILHSPFSSDVGSFLFHVAVIFGGRGILAGNSKLGEAGCLAGIWSTWQ